MNKFRILPPILLSLFVSGCSTTEFNTLKDEGEQALIAKNDAQLRISKKSLCSSALSAIHREYGGDPDKLRALFEFCGWSEHNIHIVSSFDRRAAD